MSGVGGGKSASRRLADEVLTPLLARLAALKTFLSERGLLEKIERDLAELKDVVRRVEETDKEIRYSFDSIERHIDDALRAAPETVVGIHSKLSAVDAEMAAVKAKVRAAYNNLLPVPAGNDCCRQEEGPAREERAVEATSNPRFPGSPPVDEFEEALIPATRHLRLAVDGFEERLRGCVLCLAAFPEGDVAVKKRLLIHWWIAEGFVGSSTQGSSLFRELVDKGFVTPLPKPHCGKIHQCKLPRLVLRDVLADVAGRSAFLGADLSTARRAMLQHGGKAAVAAAPPLRFNPEVRAIYNISQKYVQLGEGWFAGKKELRALQLGQWRQFGPRQQMADPSQSHIEVTGTEHLADLEECTNLRYISFRGISRIRSLPNSIGKLRELVVLDLRACHDLEELGQGITKLNQLQYLDLSECHLLIGIPKGIGRLTRLEVLKGFVIASGSCKDPCRLHELTKLQRLRKLSITIGKMAAPALDEFKKLGELNALKSLTIVWGVQKDESPAANSPPISGREFALPPHLEKLDLRCFPLPNFQRWVRPKDVKKLYIRGGNLTTLGDDEDWEAQVLQLRFLKYFHYDHGRLQRSFKKLRPDLTLIHECPNFRAEQSRSVESIEAVPGIGPGP
ncbi:hypothetical protein ACP4OV_012085 [Aristida adscensionis]